MELTMAGKKERAFFVCPQWSDVPGTIEAGKDKTIAAIAAGKPVVRSALRRALTAARLRAGKPFDIDAYIVDSRTGPGSTTPRA
jgi:hypothetical protein